MSTTLIQRDERTVAVENASYRWSYLVLSFGLLAIVAYRSFVRHESAWDLLALIVFAGVASTAYQGLHKVLSRQWALITAATLIIAGVISAAIVSFH
ncbi:MAG: hypothetical protein HY000_09175 [Planctomycetes bacterium]|nr:hypothetical protein [Planctomycetota bacterium]